MRLAAGPEETDAIVIQPEGEGIGRPHFALHLVLCGEEPLLGSAAFDLNGIEDLAIGRGPQLALLRDSGGPWRLEVPDSAISRHHVRLRLPIPGAPSLEDLGSRNGTHLRGKAVTHAIVDDGDWFVAGRSGFLLRAVDRPVARVPASVPGSATLATFLPALAKDLARLSELGASRVPVFLLGETGTGKEVVAREIHALSGRKGGLVAVNCAALPETLVESELFGYRRGAFSEAREDRPGLIRSADKGTLLLDEIGELAVGSQAKLLRVLQEGEVMALGATAPTAVDVRIVAASQRRLEDMVASGGFRPDLAGRLSGFTLSLPRLADRMEDLGLLVAALLRRYAGEQASTYRVTSAACAALLERRWPYNVRELARTIEMAVTLSRGHREIGVDHLGTVPEDVPEDDPNATTDSTPTGRPDALRTDLLARMKRNRGNVSAVAREMGKARMQVHRWLDRYGLRATDFRGG